MAALMPLGCASKEQPVNPDVSPTASVIVGRPNESMNPNANPLATGMVQNYVNDPSLKPLVTALSGRVLTQAGGLPSPVNQIRVELSRESAKDGFEKVATTTTDADGVFRFTRKLGPGTYLLRAESRQFVGEMRVRLSRAPVTDLVLEVQEKSAANPSR